MNKAFAIILAGGNGERFWPLSTAEKPKQFLDLFGGKPMIRLAVDRLSGLIPPERVYVITAERLVDLTRRALPAVPAANIIGEPCRRDTAAAVASACGVVLRQGGPDAVGCILTADALIEPVEAFTRNLADAIAVAAESNAIVTLGIRPSRPDTGFGYIACAEPHPAAFETRVRKVARFVEKPDAVTAAKYLEDGNYLWNSGSFIWKASVMRQAFAAHAADMLPLVEAVATGPDVTATLATFYPNLRAISVDYAVMEHFSPILVAEATFDWDDVGSWVAVENHFPADAQGNVILGDVILEACHGVTAVNRTQETLALYGLSDVVVVRTEKATMVTSKTAARNLKPLVKRVLAAGERT